MFSAKDLLLDRRAETVCLEDFPSISVAELREAGVLPSAGRKGQVWPNVELCVTSGGFKLFTIRYSQDNYTITMIVDDSYKLSGSQRVHIVRRVYGVAERFLLVCPVTKAEVVKLYVVEGRLVSRHADNIPYGSQLLSKSQRLIERHDDIVSRIKGIDGFEPARGRALRKLLAALRAFPMRSELWPQDDDLIEAYTEEPLSLLESYVRQTRNDLARRRRGTTATDRAIDRLAEGGEEPVPAEVVLSWVSDHDFGPALEQYRQSLHGSPETEWPGLSLPTAVLEDHPVIDVRVIQRRGLIRRGEVTPWAMCWADPENFPFGGAYFAADLRSDTLPHLRVTALGETVDTLQVIGLIDPGQATRGRWLFKDPASSLGCEVLALRNGLFARRQSQRLVHGSQMRGRGRA
jgi:hypothetical protein